MKNARGFTLIEVMVSVAILGFIMVLLWSSTSQSLDTKDRVEKRDRIFQQGRVALRKLTDDLVTAFLVKRPSSQPSSQPSEEVESVPSLKSFFIGEDAGDRDSIRFTTLSHLRLIKDARESDQAKVFYEVVDNPEDPHLYDLVRREGKWLDDKNEVQGRAFVLAEGLREFNVEYYDERGADWKKEWDSEKVDWRDRLPHAVRINIAFPNPDNEDENIPMSTAVLLPLSEAVIEM